MIELKKNNSGVTIIMLGVTVVVLIILAGITINTLIGDDGILDKAKEQKDEIEYEQAYFANELAEYKGELARENTTHHVSIGPEYDKLTESDFQGIHTNDSPGAPSEYQVKAIRTGYVNRNDIVNKLAATTSPTINVSRNAEPEIVNIKPGYYNKISINKVGDIGEGPTTATGTATAAQVLEEYTFSNSSAIGIAGQMPNNGAVNQSLDAGESYTIPAGYHNGEGKVTAGSLSSQTEGTATKPDILTGKTAWVNGEKLVGTMPNNTSENKTLAAGETYTIAQGYHDGTGTVTATGLSGQTEGTATKSDILVGKTAWVNGVKLTGEMPDNSTTSSNGTVPGLNSSYPNTAARSQTYIWNTTNTSGENILAYEVPKGYYPGSNYVYATHSQVANKISLTADKIMKGNTILGIAGTATSDANATAAQILKDKTAYVNGSKVTGTMVNWAGTPDHIESYRLQDNQFQVSVHQGYHGNYWAGNSYEYLTYSEVASKIGLTAAKIMKGNTILGIAGTATSDANATAADILKDKTAYVNGSKVTGSMKNLTTSSIYQHTSTNTTKVILGDAVFKSDVYNINQSQNSGNYIAIRYGGTAGYLQNNTLVALHASNFGDAAKADVLSGKTFTSTAGVKQTGEMTNNGAKTYSVGVGGTVNIDQGYHNGSKVSGPTLSGNATEADVASGKTFYSNNGTKKTGSAKLLSNMNCSCLKTYDGYVDIAGWGTATPWEYSTSGYSYVIVNTQNIGDVIATNGTLLATGYETAVWKGCTKVTLTRTNRSESMIRYSYTAAIFGIN